MQCSNFQVCYDLNSYTNNLLTLNSLCPMNSSVPIEAGGIIPVSQSDVAGIPSIALTIPDFEGQAILRIFSNATQSEIGCYSAVVTNGATFSHPSAVGTILGVFTLIALVASFATAIYGDHIPTTRTHYAHSLSIFVVFSVLHHIFYTGALSMNWPSVLPAFWSNYAWSAGMIYTQQMQNSINKLIGSNKGNTTIVGAAGSGSRADDLGGGYNIADIYKRSYDALFKRNLNSFSSHISMLRTERLERHLAKRENRITDASDGFSWYGKPVKPGLPLPGNFSGFAGTLSEESIPASNAFMTGFLWLLILMVLVAASIVALKWILEGLVRYHKIKEDRLTYFRTHWKGFTILAVLRICFIAFFMIMLLTLFQFTYRGSPGVIAIAAIVFAVFFVGMLGISIYACHYRLRFGRYTTSPDKLHLEKHGILPGVRYGSERDEKSISTPSIASIPFWKIRYTTEDPQREDIHHDEDYIKKFGWLASRFRKTKWWFFAGWLVYEFVRACFYGGAAGHPITQVFGLLVVEIIGLIAIVMAKPFEGSRLNALMVYILGFSKVATVALSAAFDLRFNLARITTTVIGVVIIVIQGILTIILMVAILIGAVSSYFSVMRNRSDEEFRPRKWQGYRKRYFAHLQKKATDLPPPPPPPPAPAKPKEPYFQVASVRRVAKIEDEDGDYIGEFGSTADPTSNRASTVGGPLLGGRSRANSIRSQYTYSDNIPFGAKVHRASWSSKDFPLNHSNTWQHDGAAAPGSSSRRSSGMMLASMTSLPLNARDSNASLRESSTRQQQHQVTAEYPHQRNRSQTFAGVSSSRTGTPTGIPMTPTRRPGTPGTPQRVMTPLNGDLQSQRMTPPVGMLVRGVNDGSGAASTGGVVGSSRNGKEKERRNGEGMELRELRTREEEEGEKRGRGMMGQAL